MKYFAIVAASFLLITNNHAQKVEARIPAHDPVLVKEGDTYYMFCTGAGITVYSSRDLITWSRQSPVFKTPPAWAIAAVPSFKGHIWAPDISYHDGNYFLYYSVSAFGRNTSCIGLAINKTLDTTSADYQWKDLGKVVQSVPGRDLWNAIDPNLVVDEQNIPWLTFGSFWQGIKMVRLNKAMTALSQPEEWKTLARRERNFLTPDNSAGNAALEAPFIFKKDKYYYLFVSWDYCCRAEKSDYKVVVGRSEKATGPYLDKRKNSMFDGGGSLVVEGDGKIWFGAGHNAVYTFDNTDYIVYHGYDAKDRGRAKLIIQKLQWKDGWPSIAQQPQ